MREETSLDVIVEESDGGGDEILVCSPAVGFYGDAPQVGEVLVGRSRVGRLSALGRTAELVLPRGFSGKVAEGHLRNRRDPVEYGQMLLRLVPGERGGGHEMLLGHHLRRGGPAAPGSDSRGTRRGRLRGPSGANSVRGHLGVRALVTLKLSQSIG